MKKFDRKKSMYVLLSSFTIFISFIQLLLFNQEYQALNVLSLLFSLLFSIILLPLCLNNNYYLPKIVTFCSYLKYLVMPFFYQLSPVLFFSKYRLNDISIFNEGILLQIIELVAITVFLFFQYYKKGDLIGKDKKPYMSDGKFIIYLFITIGILLLFLFPQSLKQFSFLIIKENEFGRIGANELTVWDNFLKQLLVIVIQLLYVSVINVLFEKYKQSNKTKYIFFSILITCINICIIIGEQRSAQIYSAFASFCILSRLYPKYKKKIIKIIILTAGIVLLLITIYKTFYAFNFDSYGDAIANSGYGISDLTKDMDIYLLGPSTYSSVVAFKQSIFTYPIFGFLYDFFRSFIGLSFFVKDMMFQGSSALYNLYVTNGAVTSGYLLPITGLGYIMFGKILSPIFLIVILYISSKIEKIFRTSKNICITYFSGYVFIRMASCIVSSNFNSVIVQLSSTLVFIGGLLLLNKILMAIKSSA